MGDRNVNITPTDVFKWQGYQNVVETEGLLWLKQDWRTGLTICMADEGAVYDLQQNIINFSINPWQRIRICNGAKVS